MNISICKIQKLGSRRNRKMPDMFILNVINDKNTQLMELNYAITTAVVTQVGHLKNRFLNTDDIL